MGSRRGLQARLPKAQQGPAGQPPRRAFNFEPQVPSRIRFHREFVCSYDTPLHALVSKMAEARQNVIRQVYEDPREGFGSIADTLRLARRRDPSIRRADVQRFMQGLRVREDRPQRGYNSYVPTEPMHQLQVDLADMSVFSTAPYRYMLVAIDVFTKKGAAVPLASKTAPAVANAWQQVVQSLGIPSYVYSDDGSEFKAEFKQRLDYYDVDKVVSRGHAYFVERLIRTLKEALVRRLSAGLAARNRWHQLLPDVLAQYNARTHGGTGMTPNQAYSDPSKAEHARQVMQAQAKRNAPPRPMLAVGDRVRVRVKPRENRGAYRVTETAWTEQTYQITGIEHTDMGPLFTLRGWQGGRLVAREMRKAVATEGRVALDSREARNARAAREVRLAPGPVAPP